MINDNIRTILIPYPSQADEKRDFCEQFKLSGLIDCLPTEKKYGAAGNKENKYLLIYFIYCIGDARNTLFRLAVRINRI